MTSTSSAGGAGTTSASTGGGGGVALDPFCTNFKADALANLSNASTLKDAAKAWNSYAAEAPSAIKPAAQDIAKYVNDVANGNYSDVAQQAQKIETDAQAIATYYAAHCHA